MVSQAGFSTLCLLRLLWSCTTLKDRHSYFARGQPMSCLMQESSLKGVLAFTAVTISSL